MGAAVNAHRVLIRKSGGKVLFFFFRSRHRWGDDIKMDRKEIRVGMWTAVQAG
jgi:hypothetical protein